jgi:hypothetical protein
MQIARVFVVGAMLSVAWPGHAATVRELGSAELRSIVSSGKTISLKRVVASVAHSTQSEPIEARAFDAGGVFYRIVLKRQDGMLISVIIDAATGEQVKADSAIGKTVTQAATDTSTSKAAKGKSATAGENSQGKGNGNSGGQGNGNSGNNGNGNSGNNGNSGGNGNSGNN